MWMVALISKLGETYHLLLNMHLLGYFILQSQLYLSLASEYACELLLYILQSR